MTGSPIPFWFAMILYPCIKLKDGINAVKRMPKKLIRKIKGKKDEDC